MGKSTRKDGGDAQSDYTSVGVISDAERLAIMMKVGAGELTVDEAQEAIHKLELDAAQVRDDARRQAQPPIDLALEMALAGLLRTPPSALLAHLLSLRHQLSLSPAPHFVIEARNADNVCTRTLNCW